MVSRWKVFFYNFSALNPPFTVFMLANSPLNFFLASKGTIVAYFFEAFSLSYEGCSSFFSC